MVEPAGSSKGIVALAVLMFGTVAGEYAAIVFCALAGSLWALSKVETEARARGAFLVARLVMTAVVLTGPLAWWLEHEYQWPAHRMLAPLAFAIGALGDKWPGFLDSAARRISQRLFGGGPQ
jgi:hypothetical protein